MRGDGGCILVSWVVWSFCPHAKDSEDSGPRALGREEQMGEGGGLVACTGRSGKEEGGAVFREGPACSSISRRSWCPGEVLPAGSLRAAVA
jgi:hypothetical protein